MPWQETTVESERVAFIAQVRSGEVSMSRACQEAGISRTTGYKWWQRWQEHGLEGLADQSRRPRHAPGQTAPSIEALVVAARQAHPAWGARKLHRFLVNQGHTALPAPSTITAILRRHGVLDPAQSAAHRPWQRFEQPCPNALWQMDFKSPLGVATGAVCHPLTVLDDHSRFLLGLAACPNEQAQTVQAQLTRIFQTYGLPERMLMDNGSPWGDAGDNPHTHFTVWLLRLGIRVSHGRPYHPQTQGKDERLHRTLQAELFAAPDFRPRDVPACQPAFDAWRLLYNTHRPHAALELATPASRYTPSPRPFPSTLPPLLYETTDAVRKVDSSGKISWRGQPWRIGKPFAHLPVALRPDPLVDGLVHVVFAATPITSLSLHAVSSEC